VVEPEGDGAQDDASSVGRGELVVAGGDAAPLLGPAEEVLDFVSPPVKPLGTIGFLESSAAVRDDRQRAFILDLLAHPRAVVGLVRGDRERRSRRGQHLFDDLAVVHLSAGYREAERPAFAIDNRVDFRGSTAAADADRLIFLPPFAPLAAR